MSTSLLTPVVVKIHLKSFNSQILNLENYAVMLHSPVPLCFSESLFDPMSFYFWGSFTLCVFMGVGSHVHS